MSRVKRMRVAGVSPLDEQLHKGHPPWTGGIKLEERVDVLRPPMDCYRLWRDFENLPRFMRHLDSVAALDEKRSHWSVEGPGDSYIEWDAEIIADEPGQLISWRSLPGAQIENAGSVHFVPAAGGQATEVKVALTYNPPAGVLGEAFAILLGDNPRKQLEEDLDLFKQLAEGEARDRASPVPAVRAKRPVR